MRTRGGARPGGDAHAPFYAGGTASRFSGSHAQAFCRRSNGNILRRLCEVSAGPQNAPSDGAARGSDSERS